MISKLIKLFLVTATLLLTGSCSFLTPQGHLGEYHEKYTITFESTGPKPLEQKPSPHPDVLDCFPPPPDVIPAPATPKLSESCSADKDCSDKALVDYIQQLRTIMTENKKHWIQYVKDHDSCLRKLNGMS